MLTPDFPPAVGGIQLLAHRVCAGMRRFEPRVVALDSPGAAAYDLHGDLPVARSPGGVPRPAANALLNVVALREAARFRPHAVLAVHLACSPAAALVRRLRPATASALYVHADEMEPRPWLTRFALRQADLVVAVSAHTRGMALAAGARAEDVVVIPPGVDLPPGRLAERAVRPTVITVARLTDRYKGHDVVLDALVRVRERVPDVEWVVVGDGPLRPELETRAAQLGLTGVVRFTGSVGDAERDARLDAAHVFVMPSRLPASGSGGEGFGIVYTEAGAHGLPVVAGDVAGALDAVEHERTGLLVDPTRPAAVAQALTDLLLDPSRAAAMGRAAALRARGLAWPTIAARVEDALLRTLVRGAPDGCRTG